MRKEDQDRAVQEVISRVMGGVLTGGSQQLENALADTLYHEHQRIEKQHPSASRTRGLARLERQRHRLVSGSDGERRRVLHELIEFFAREVLGYFDPKVHALVTRAIPLGLTTLLKATSPRQLLRWREGNPLRGLEERLLVDGHLEHVLALRELGTVIFCPTHSSNLDSIVLGYGMHEEGFPPLLYGAGLNLFTNPILSYFLRNLGAYRVDRRKKAPLYKEVLKTYAQVSIEFGYHNLFFPGGTRARGGAVEKKLKLGLLGTGLDAYHNNLRVRRPRPRVFIIPMVLSFELVLEAETLIDDFLRSTGQARYIISDDEFASPRRVLQFLGGILELDTRIHLTLMEPLDPFGNRVDREGNSFDNRGRRIEIDRYLRGRDGELRKDPGRDREYTRLLGEKLVDAFHRGNTVMATHVVAFALFQELRRLNPGLDLYRLLRTGGSHESIAFSEALRLVDTLRERLRALAKDGRLILEERAARLPADQLLLLALKAFGTYHTRPAVERLGDRVYHRDRNLLYYYRNRLLGYGLEANGR